MRVQGRSVSSPTTRATAIASMLSAMFGDAPAEDERDERIRIEATVPASLSEAARLDLLAFLFQMADRFGHQVDKDGTSRIWAEVDREEIPAHPVHKSPDAESEAQA